MAYVSPISWYVFVDVHISVDLKGTHLFSLHPSSTPTLFALAVIAASAHRLLLMN
jgi:hypothetical protein